MQRVSDYLRLLSFFVKPEVIRRTRDLASIKYLDSSVHLPDSDIYVGDGTTALLLHLQENEGQPVDAFYNRVKQFYQPNSLINLTSNQICSKH